ncbi:MAG TPA: phosphoglucosamine mutase [Longimicrobiales bacterium]|nr:phosphoglucosamine mutase [Longimicrobiales bacterium]
MSFEIPRDLMVSVSGVRGRVGAGLTPEVVARFAAAFGAYLAEEAQATPLVVMGRDSRTSGPMFARAASAGLMSVGAHVVDIGVAPTPTTLFAIRPLRADGAVVVTASHNPVEWNALKFASRDGMFLDAEEAQRMREHLPDGELARAGWDGLGSHRREEGAVERHLEAILSLPLLHTPALRARRFRVALDCVRGAGGRILPELLERLGCEVLGINLEADGRFPREPEPVAANLGELCEHVRATGADLGMATDPDADRLSLVDETGAAIGEDYTLAIAASLVVRRRPGPIVTNLSTSALLDDVAGQAGVEVVRAPVGEIHVARRMQQVGAPIGGEGNGGVILPDIHHTRDAMVAAALTLQALLEADKPLSALTREWPSYAIVKDKAPRGERDLAGTYEILAARLGAPARDRQDGLRLAWPDEGRWLHLRPSGTEPILRIIAEARTPEAARHLIESARAALAAAG